MVQQTLGDYQLKQLHAKTSKSRYVVIGQQKSRIEILKEAELNPIMMGTTVIENSISEKYLGDQIHEDGCEASITATLNGRIPGAIEVEYDRNHLTRNPKITLQIQNPQLKFFKKFLRPFEKLSFSKNNLWAKQQPTLEIFVCSYNNLLLYIIYIQLLIQIK